jgi:uncharacterized surface anchored protein
MLNPSLPRFWCFHSLVSKHLVALSFLVCLLLAVAPVPLYSQANAGSVSGLVTDASGGTVAGATITLTDKSTNTPRSTTSNEAGRYFFANVPPGNYEITANKTGFRLSKVSDITVVVGTPLSIDFTLRLGEVSDTVVVEAAGATLQTLNSSVGTTMAFNQLQELPNLSRDVSSLVTLQPATAPNGSVAGAVTTATTWMAP